MVVASSRRWTSFNLLRSDRVEGRRAEGAARTEAGRRERRRGRRSIAAVGEEKRREKKEDVIVGREEVFSGFGLGRRRRES